MPGLLEHSERDSAYDIVGSATGAVKGEKRILPDKGGMTVVRSDNHLY